MGYAPLRIRAGVDVEQTPLLNETGWAYSTAARFRDGLAEKTGGFVALNVTPLVGVCTGMHAWSDLDTNSYIACGTDQRLEIYSGGTLSDITPLRATHNVTPDFTTVINTATVTVKDTAHGAAEGDWVNILVPVSVGGLILQGLYQVQSVVDPDNYTITVASDATASVSNGGAVPNFGTTNTSGDVVVTLNDHGLVAGSTFAVQVSTTVGGLTIGVDLYSVIAPVTTNTFTIQPGGVASSTTTGFENGGDVRLQYLIPTGFQSATPVGGYGVGIYGDGLWGVSGSGTVIVPPRIWFLDNFGEDLVASYIGSPLYIWQPPVASENRALELNSTNFPAVDAPPTAVNVSFVVAPQQMIMVLGCDGANGEAFNPMRVRWCNQGGYLTWKAAPDNTAGSYIIPEGSKLVGGISAPNFTVIWTDIGMWLANYLGGTGEDELVWGFNQVADAGCDLLAPKACAVYGNIVFFVSANGLYRFNGNSFDLIPCPVWDKLWKNLDREQIDKVNLQVNSWFQEVAIAFPSLTGDGTVDSRITYNIRENSWTYDDPPTVLARTAWIDENAYGPPVGTDLSGYMQQQDGEGVYDANGVAMAASIRTGWFSAQEGTLLTMLERIEADLIVTGGTGEIFLTVYTQDYATGPVRTYGPYSWIVGSGPPFFITRARGRFMSIEISSTGAGIFWRVGNIRMKTNQAGKRP